MLGFDIRLRPGEPPSRQIVYAATKAVLSGELQPGDVFPSVRELSQALKINPNTSQKVIAELTRGGLLEVRPGVGTIVAAGRRASAEEKRHLLSHDVERLVVEAKRLGLTRVEITKAVASRWDALFGARPSAER
jgi:GntR family transcriptional regulator